MKRRAPAALAAAVLLGGCSDVQSSLSPHGPVAERLADLWWAMFWTLGAAFLVTATLVLLAVRRGRRAGPAEEPSGGERRIIVTAGAVIPLLVLSALLVATVRVGSDVARPPSAPRLTVEVVGHQFWWEVRYPGEGGDTLVTANEVHIPVGRPVRLLLRTADVIHSFWVPQLAGKTDMVPGRPNTLWLEAREPGLYRGQCAEFCGLQHAKMALLVVAEPEARFEAWLAREREPAPAPATDRLRRGQRVFRDAGCSLCHAIRGVKEPGATGEPGPDLTHLAGRRTLAAATLPNTRGHLGGWILDPQAFKPGNRMPPTVLDSEDLHALLDYLESLE